MEILCGVKYGPRTKQLHFAKLEKVWKFVWSVEGQVRENNLGSCTLQIFVILWVSKQFCSFH